MDEAEKGCILDQNVFSFCSLYGFGLFSISSSPVFGIPTFAFSPPISRPLRPCLGQVWLWTLFLRFTQTAAARSAVGSADTREQSVMQFKEE